MNIFQRQVDNYTKSRVAGEEKILNISKRIQDIIGIDPLDVPAGVKFEQVDGYTIVVDMINSSQGQWNYVYKVCHNSDVSLDPLSVNTLSNSDIEIFFERLKKLV